MTTLQSRGLPSTARIGLSRGQIELREFFRSKEAVIFTFSLPAILLLLLGSIEHQQYAGQLLTAGMIGAGVVSTSFVSVGTGIALDREDGTLKRLRGTPMPAAAYFVGKLVLVLVSSLAEVALLLVIGTLVFHVQLPGTGSGWLRLAWVFLLGVVGCTMLGIAASNLTRSARSAPAVLNLVFIVLEFVSGIFVVPITSLPGWMVQVASLFPVKWLAQGFRSVFLPDNLRVLEAAGQWETGKTALVLGVWCLAGLVLCLATFRWTNRRAG
ncbi:MAG TPA: ABC transporter permease [Pseudonocardiaceae bacterium]|jgi:ABC-2 type transport system permease protein